MGVLQKVKSVSSIQDLLSKFKKFNPEKFPDFYLYKGPLERALWVLWIAKDGLNIKRLSAEEIATIIVEVKEISTDSKSIINSFNRAKEKVHIHKQGKKNLYEIMRPGKEFLEMKAKGGFVSMYYFEPDRRFSSKRILSRDIFDSLHGELMIVDPYCGERTLDILKNTNLSKDTKGKKVRFLTRLGNLNNKEKDGFIRELKDFKTEFPNFEFRDCSDADIHDRYIVSSDKVVILGHSMKDLGKKESFAIILDKMANRNISKALIENFNRRWEGSIQL
jgi:hypothetical protein